MKRFLSSLLSIVIVCSCFSCLAVTSASALDSRIESAVQWAINIANDNSHGYSQLASRRWGNPDYDCSSLVITAFKNFGFNVGSATYTGNMRTPFEKAGFTWISKSQINLSNSSQLQRGDILLNEKKHVEIYIGNNQRVGAHTGYVDIYDTNYPGDNNGKEICIYNYTNSSNWDGVLRYNGVDTCNCSDSYAGNYTVTTNSSPLSMRSGHGTGYSVITSIPKGEQVYVSKSDGNWAHVKWNGYDGFCSMQYLTKNTPQEPELDPIVDLGNSFSARIKHCNSEKLLTNVNDNVVLYENQNDNIANQIWKFQKNGNGSYKIIGSVSDVAMDLDCASDIDGTNIKLYTNYSTIAQNWFIHQSSDGLYYFRSECSQTRVFDLCSGATDNGTNLQLWTYNGTDAQKFGIYKCGEILNLGDEFKGFIMNTDCWKPIMQTDDYNVVLGTENTENMKRSLWHFYRNNETGYYTIYNYLNGKCLDVHNASDEEGANVQCFDQHDSSAQKWFILRSSDGAYTYMKAACSSKNLDVENGSTEDGANIQMYTLNGTSAQRFTIYQLDETRDKISYNLVTNKSNINVGDSVLIEITNASYAIDYKLYIVSPNGSRETVDLDMNNKYSFSPSVVGKYTLFASVESPVSSYTGSEARNSVEIIVNANNSLGDVDGNGEITIMDVTEIQRHIAQLITIPNDRIECADTDRDGEISIKDATNIQRFIAQLITEL